VRFNKQQQDVFSGFSRDVNPLHLDAAYARRTSFGQPVVFGVAGLMMALGTWADGRHFSILKIKAEFKKPLFLDEDYEIAIQTTGAQVTIRFLKGVSLRQKLSFTWEPWFGQNNLDVLQTFNPRATSASGDTFDVPAILASQQGFHLNGEFASAFADFFKISMNQMPIHQLSSLLWASYMIGMEAPGQQALFTNLEFEFEQGPVSPNLQFKSLDLEIYEDLFKQITCSGQAQGIPKFQMSAFCRPCPVNYRLADVHSAADSSQTLVGATWLVTGASRGFGSALAMTLAHHGAELILHYNQSEEAVTELQKEIEAAGGRATLLRADLTDAEQVQNIKTELMRSDRKLGGIIHNAAPLPPTLALNEQSTDELVDYVSTTLRMTNNLEFLLPLLSPEGRCVVISSIFVAEPVAKFSAYITAKFALEGLIQSWTLEHPTRCFLILRPPRMLTDVTNTIQTAEPPPSALEIAGRAVQEFFKPFQRGLQIKALTLTKEN
jgi:NAD(P)-dependent dehydrogenase (short-subunit alcohol dehydrogenase family)